MMKKIFNIKKNSIIQFLKSFFTLNIVFYENNFFKV